MLNFGDWLTSQQKRQDNIGFLAYALLGQEVQLKSSKRNLDEHKYWVDIVTKIDGPGYIYVFNDAWQEYIHAREAEKNMTDQPSA
jgi:hypothetical protein